MSKENQESNQNNSRMSDYFQQQIGDKVNRSDVKIDRNVKYNSSNINEQVVESKALGKEEIDKHLINEVSHDEFDRKKDIDISHESESNIGISEVFNQFGESIIGAYGDLFTLTDVGKLAEKDSREQKQQQGYGKLVLAILFWPAYLMFGAIVSPFYLIYSLYHEYSDDGDDNKVVDKLRNVSIVGTILLTIGLFVIMSIRSSNTSGTSNNRAVGMDASDYEVSLVLRSEREVHNALVELGEVDFSNYTNHFPSAKVDEPHTLSTSHNTKTLRINDIITDRIEGLEHYDYLVDANGHTFRGAVDTYLFGITPENRIDLVGVSLKDNRQYAPLLTNQTLIPDQHGSIAFQENLLLHTIQLSKK